MKIPIKIHSNLGTSPTFISLWRRRLEVIVELMDNTTISYQSNILSIQYIGGWQININDKLPRKDYFDYAIRGSDEDIRISLALLYLTEEVQLCASTFFQ